MALALLLAFFAFAALDWFAVATGRHALEYVAKPAALAALLGWAATGTSPSPWLLAALACSLLGDVFLMLPRDAFRAGLTAFLLAHLAYIADFDVPVTTRALGLAVILVVTAPLAQRVLRAVPDAGLRALVAVYSLALSLTAASAIASGNVVAATGGVLFLLSDLLLGWNRFVGPAGGGHLGVMVTYHAAQLALVAYLRSTVPAV